MKKLFGAVFMGLFIAGSVSAATFANTTYLKFSGDVALPGVVLPAGEYVFELADPYTTRSVVRVLNRQRTHAFAQVLTRRTERRSSNLPATVRLGEARSGSPQPIVAWFPAGQSSGYEFIY